MGDSSLPTFDRILDWLTDWWALLLIATLMLAGGAYTYAAYVNEHTITCTVTDKDRTQRQKGGSDARVYTEDCGTLQVADAMFKGHFSSADTYASIEVGHTYKLTVIGFRIPVMSTFPNVIKVREVSP